MHEVGKDLWLRRLTLPFAYDPSLDLQARTVVPVIETAMTISGANTVIGFNAPCFSDGTPLFFPYSCLVPRTFKLRALHNLAYSDAEVYYSPDPLSISKPLVKAGCLHLEKNVPASTIVRFQCQYPLNNNPDGLPVRTRVSVMCQNSGAGDLYAGAYLRPINTPPTPTALMSLRYDFGGVGDWVFHQDMNRSIYIDIENSSGVNAYDMAISFSVEPILAGG
jgi:hypothetical protein